MGKVKRDYVSTNYVKSPIWVAGQREQFGVISRMISHWEELKGEETSRGGGLTPGVRRGRRRSKMTDELMGRFGERRSGECRNRVSACS